METTATKTEVVNPITLFNTIGAELHDIFSSNNISIDNLCKLGIDPKELDSKTKFTKHQIKEIVSITGINEIEDYLNRFQHEYLISKAKAELDYKKNLAIYRKVKHLKPLLNNDFNEGIDLLEDISEFLAIEDETKIFERVNENIALYRISNFEPDNLNLYAWLKRGEVDFNKLSIQAYNEAAFIEWVNKGEWKEQLTNIEYFKELPKIVSAFGVGVVFTPYFKKTVHGAVRWFNGNPLIQISDKGKCLATAWYTLFHEFGHVLKHRNDQIFEENIDIPKTKATKKEQEANAFAYEHLFNGDGLRKHTFSYYNKGVNDAFIQKLAKQFSVNNIFVAYWMKKAQIKNKCLNQHLLPITFK